jgi:mitochondrial import inner membrane translocase subunit TIM50
LDAAKFVNWSIYDFTNLMMKPQMTKMLPDRPNIPGYAHPKTLVLNMNGTLVHQSYKLGVGVEVFKRPGLSTFLQRMSRQYEIVIFGNNESGTINEICEALDPNYQMIQGRYGRENTVLKDGKYIKDLSYMNRPLKDVIYIDYTDENVDFHRENAIILS